MTDLTSLPPMLFHGTGAMFDDPPRPGSDGLFWCALDPATAQNYIPATGGKVFAGFSSYEKNQSVAPHQNDPFFSIALSLSDAAPSDVQRDFRGRATSYRIPKGWPTYQDVGKHIEEVLGYENQHQGSGSHRYALRSTGWDAVLQLPTIVHNDYREVGQLLIIEGFEHLRLLDISTGEGDLSNPQHSKLRLFAQARAQGYDGMVIDDFCQSENWGNVGHTAVGFFDHAIPDLTIHAIDACRHEWGLDRQALMHTSTPEFEQWQQERLSRARHKQA